MGRYNTTIHHSPLITLGSPHQSTLPAREGSSEQIVPTCSNESSLSEREVTTGNDELIEAKQMQIFRQKKSIGKPGGSDGKTMTINQGNFNTANVTSYDHIRNSRNLLHLTSAQNKRKPRSVGPINMFRASVQS